MYHGDTEYATSWNETIFPLSRTDTSSSVSTNATASNLPGPGRTVGLLLDWLGAHVEKCMNLWADQSGLGPNAVAQEIRRLRRHDETSVVERHAGSVVQLLGVSERDEKTVRKLCKKLLKYARYVLRICFLRLIFSFSLKGTKSGLLNYRLWKKLYALQSKMRTFA